jgi:hypothetical protein
VLALHFLFHPTMSNIQPPMNGTEQRLDAVLEELRAIRKRIEEGCPVPAEAIEIREPQRTPPQGGSGVGYALRKRK